MAGAVVGGTQGSALYAPSVQLDYESTEDNALIAIVALNGQGATAKDDYDVSSVIDDAHNTWTELIKVGVDPSSSDPYVGVRIAIWACTGAGAIESLTVTATQTVDAIGVILVEASGITNVSPVDVTGSGSNASASSLSPAATTTNAADLILGGVAVGDTGKTLTRGTTNSWTDLTGVTTASGISAKDNVALRAAYKVLSSIGAQSTTWNVTAGAAGVYAAVALKAGTVDKTNPNPNWPKVTHEIGFGVDPNDPQRADTWVDVTNRVVEIDSRRGRDYELARTEAGESDVKMSNYDGALDPTNADSPYYPNVKVMTPYRMRAIWNGRTYSVFRGYVERWPQTWDNEWGQSPVVVVDGLATLAASKLNGTLGSEILAGDPYAYWPLNDGAGATQAKNSATTTSDALVESESINHGGSGTFSADLALAGEEDTCWKQSRSGSATTDSPDAIYGTCLTGAMTLPALSSGVLLECWASIPSTEVQFNYTLMALKASGFTSRADRLIASLQLDAASGLPTVQVSNSSGVLATFNANASGFANDSWHHYAVHITTTRVRLWVDGALRVDGSLVSVPSYTPDLIEVGGQVDTWTNINIAVGTFAHVAIFVLTDADERLIAARANAGLFGFPERSGARMSRLLNYAGWTAGRAIDQGLSFLGGTATLGKQTLLGAAQDVASWENGLAFVDSAGNMRFVDRENHFNQTTAVTFGDGPGEIPYETDVEIQYDPQYIFNDVTITKQAGGSAAHKVDQSSIKTYFTRTLDKTSGVSSLSQCQAEATWTLENYAQPKQRLATIAITPSANPDLWPIALGLEIGQRVTVKRRPRSGQVITLDCYIEQVAHQVTTAAWRTVYSLSPALDTTYGAQNDWILNTSPLDQETIVG